MIRRTLLAAALCACTAPVHPPAVPTPPNAFGCVGAPDLVAPPPPPVTPGRLEVSRTANGIRIYAEDAPVSRLAARIGEALNLETRVDSGLEQVALTIASTEITIDSLAKLLDPLEVVVAKRDGVLSFRNSANWGGTARHPDLEPVISIVVEPRGGATAEQMAGLFCRTFASPVGSAQVMGTRLLLFDRRTRLDRFDATMRAFAAATAVER